MSRWPVQTLAERFWSRVDKSGEHWLWPEGSCNEQGYGIFVVRAGKKVKAHRMAWELEFGPIPPGQNVLHHCDIRACVRPRDLFLGTQQDNVRDMLAKGRGAWQSLIEAKVREIRVLALCGWTKAMLARRYHLTEFQVQRILDRRAWRHIA